MEGSSGDDMDIEGNVPPAPVIEKVTGFIDRILNKMLPHGEELSEDKRQFLVKKTLISVQNHGFVDVNESLKLTVLQAPFNSVLPPDFDTEAFDVEAKVFLKDFFPPMEKKNFRMVPIDYEITNTTLSHEYDLKLFEKTVEKVASEWKEHKENGTYIAPYFCFIQSSGMGKTKLMYQFADLVNNNNDSKMSCDLVLSTNGLLLSNHTKVFELALTFPSALDSTTLKASEASRIVHEYLDATFLEDDSKLRKMQPMKAIHIIMFDEAQFLLETRYKEQAFLFRCIRVWLRAKKYHNATIVAVFTGTSSALNNYNVKDDKNLEVLTSSRESYLFNYYKQGTKSFPPFMCTTTMGVLWSAGLQDQTEYEKSIGYGRPLFAVMQKNGHLKSNIGTLLHRLLLTRKYSTTDWHDQESSWLSVLATRVQMGSTTVNLTAELVEKGYANLIRVFEGETAAVFSYLPDPVCARLAMCMMDEKWEVQYKNTQSNFKGQSKIWWGEKVKELYSSGLCRPDKGSVGEVLVALYFLFCGDECRSQCLPDNKDYETFSVPLNDWVDSLTSKSSPLITHVQPNKKAKRSTTTSAIEVSFIQVCRNCIQGCGQSWRLFSDQQFLGHLYSAGTAFYTYSCCPLIDLAAPMRITQGAKVSFAGLLVSVKSRVYVCPADAAKLCENMKKKADEDKCRSTLCLLVVFGQTITSNEVDVWKWNQAMVNRLVAGENIAVLVRIPFNDRFKLTAVLNELTSFDTEQLLESHSFIRALSEDSKKELFEEDEILPAMNEFHYAQEESSARARTA